MIFSILVLTIALTTASDIIDNPTDACLSKNYACENYSSCCANGGYLVDGRTEVCSQVSTYAKAHTCGDLSKCTTAILLFGSTRFPQDLGLFDYVTESNSGKPEYRNHVSEERLYFEVPSSEWRVSSNRGRGGTRVVGEGNVASPDHVNSTWRTCCWRDEPAITATCIDDEPTFEAPIGYTDLGYGMCSNSGLEWEENVGTLNAQFSFSGVSHQECAQLCTDRAEFCLGYSILAPAEACFLHVYHPLGDDSSSEDEFQVKSEAKAESMSMDLSHWHWSSANSWPINSTAVHGTHWGAPLELFRCFNKTEETDNPTSMPTSMPSSAPTSRLRKGREESSSQSFYSLIAILAVVLFF